MHKLGKRNGPGTLQYENGTILKSNFFNDLAHESGEIDYINSDKYIGEYYQGQK